MFVTCGPFPRLTHVRLHNFHVGQPNWTELLESVSPSLTSLDLGGCTLGIDATMPLVWRRLEELLVCQPFGAATLCYAPNYTLPCNAWPELRVLVLDGAQLTETILDACPKLEFLGIGQRSECTLDAVIAIVFGTRASRVAAAPSPTYSIGLSPLTRVTPDARWRTCNYRHPGTGATHKIAMGDGGQRIATFIAEICGPKRRVQLREDTVDR